MKKTFAFIFLIVFNAHSHASLKDWTFTPAIPKFAMLEIPKTKHKVKENYEKKIDSSPSNASINANTIWTRR